MTTHHRLFPPLRMLLTIIRESESESIAVPLLSLSMIHSGRRMSHCYLYILYFRNETSQPQYEGPSPSARGFRDMVL